MNTQIIVEADTFRLKILKRMFLLSCFCEFLAVIAYLGIFVITQNILFFYLFLLVASGLIPFYIAYKISDTKLDLACWLLITSIIAELVFGYYMLGNNIPIPAAFTYPISLSSAILPKKQALFVSAGCVIVIVISVVSEYLLRIYLPPLSVAVTPEKIWLDLVVYAAVVPGCALILNDLHTSFYKRLIIAAKITFQQNEELSQTLLREQSLLKMNSKLNDIQQKMMKKTSDNLHDEIITKLRRLINFYDVHNSRSEYVAAIESLIRDVRNVMGNLWPHTLANSFMAAVNEMVTILKYQYPNINFIVDEGTLVPILDYLIDINFRVTLYYIIRESVYNAINHSQADEIIIAADLSRERPDDDDATSISYKLEIFVQDNGCGFDLSLLHNENAVGEDGSPHRGLHLIQTNTQLLGGEVEFFVRKQDSPNAISYTYGTSVNLTFSSLKLLPRPKANILDVIDS